VLEVAARGEALAGAGDDDAAHGEVGADAFGGGADGVDHGDVGDGVAGFRLVQRQGDDMAILVIEQRIGHGGRFLPGRCVLVGGAA